MAMMTLEAFKSVFWPYKVATVPRGFSCITDGETNVLLTLIDHFKPKKFVEIGTFKGGTAERILADSPCIEEYIAVDCSDPNREVPLAVEEVGFRAKGDPRYKLMISMEGSKNPEAEKLEADMVFIDANHSYEWCMHDSLLAHRIVKDGGIVAWHDFDYCDGVTKAIVSLNNHGEDGIIWVRETHVCFEIVHDKTRPGFMKRLEDLGQT